MKLSTAFIDLRGLAGLRYAEAARDIHRALDPAYELRMMIGNALAPPGYAAVNLGYGLWFVGMVR